MKTLSSFWILQYGFWAPFKQALIFSSNITEKLRFYNFICTKYEYLFKVKDRDRATDLDFFPRMFLSILSSSLHTEHSFVTRSWNKYISTSQIDTGSSDLFDRRVVKVDWKSEWKKRSFSSYSSLFRRDRPIIRTNQVFFCISKLQW